MNQSKEAKARENMRGVDRNYPGFPYTSGPCANKCGGRGRGGGLCGNCYEDLLAEQCGAKLAKEYHQKVKSLAFTVGRVMDNIEANQ